MASVRSLSALRGVTAAVFATFVALFSHIVGGGSVPGTLGIVVPLVFSVFISVLLTGRKLSLLRLSISVALSQFLFHALFMLGTTSRVSANSALSGHAAHGNPLVLDSTVVPVSHGTHFGFGMWLAHGLAGIITVAVLYWAETLLRTIAAIKGHVIGRFAEVLRIGSWAAPDWPTRMQVRGFVPTLSPLGVFPSTSALRGPPHTFCS